MRAKLLKVWPALSYMYGLKPWDIGRLSAAELLVYLDDLEETNRARMKGR